MARREDNLQARLDRDLAELKLAEIARSYREVLDDAARKGSSMLEVLAILIGLAQFVLIFLNAVSRQAVQKSELARYFEVTEGVVRIQWSPMILFLLLFVAGIALITWMIMQAVKSGRNPEPPGAAG